MGSALSVVLAVGIPLAGGIGIGLTIQGGNSNWYKSLKKPSWNPPNWIFGPVWTALYAMMGTASWMVWRNGGGVLPLGLYAAQLLLNFAWTPLFFKENELGYALADISALLGVLGATIFEFHKVSPAASYLMLPYLAWTSFATALTYDLWKRNPSKRGQGKSAGDLAGDVAAGVKQGASTAAAKAQAAGQQAGDKAQELRSRGQAGVDKAGEKAKEEGLSQLGDDRLTAGGNRKV